jgi:hypothetical protein
MDIEASIEYYKDNLGRMDLKPVNKGEASTNNQLLYTGELAILMKLAGGYTPADFNALAQAVRTCQLADYPGLYTRHPAPYRFKTKDGLPNFVPVSFDEILGACFTNWCAGNIRENEDILQHTQLTDNRFCDIPGYELMDSYESVFKPGLFAELKRYYQKAKTYEKLETGFRKEVRNFSRFFPIFFKHSSTNVFCYTASANRDAGFLSSVLLFASAILASVKKDNLSTKVLWWFRFRFLELTGKETFLTKLAKQYYNYTNKNRLGEFWENELFAEYYEDRNHPFHELVKDVQDRR